MPTNIGYSELDLSGDITGVVSDVAEMLVEFDTTSAILSLNFEVATMEVDQQVCMVDL